jgi:hypothetical protein
MLLKVLREAILAYPDEDGIPVAGTVTVEKHDDRFIARVFCHEGLRCDVEKRRTRIGSPAWEVSDAGFLMYAKYELAKVGVDIDYVREAELVEACRIPVSAEMAEHVQREALSAWQPGGAKPC